MGGPGPLPEILNAIFAIPADYPAMSKRGEVIIEFYRVGAFVKVSAVDVATSTEVSIMGPVNAGEETLTRVVMRKLEYVLERQRKDAPAPPRGLLA